MANIFVQEDYVNVTEHTRGGESDPQESSFTTRSEVYHFCLRQFGKCVGRVYVDDSNGIPRSVGWIFQKRAKYSDCNQTFLQEVWITLHEAPPEHKTIYHYL